MAGQTPLDPNIVVYPGARAPNPNVFYGQDDIVTVPTVFPRYSTPWNQIQLSNGVDRGDQGKRDTNPPSNYLYNAAPFQPGQTRMSGTSIGDFPMQGAGYQQWQVYVQTTAGMEPTYNGGPGIIAANGIINPGTGA